ncbi:MAG: hypothetical protein WD738_12565 [Pirellulales bacterium]
MPSVSIMHEIWLQPNRRAIWLGCLPPLIVSGLGAWLAFAYHSASRSWARPAGFVLIVAGLGLSAMLLRQLFRPRIAYHDGYVLFYMRAGRPIRVPVSIVEAFFLGQGPAQLPVGARREDTVNLVARLSQRHTEWAMQHVKPALGSWCDGYVTIRGTWCEPLGTETIRRLNRRLKEVKK